MAEKPSTPGRFIVDGIGCGIQPCAWERALLCRRCRTCLAPSSSRRRVGERFLPARLMKYWIMRMAEPSPFGETLLRAIVDAICRLEPVNVRAGGCVESVVT